MPSPVPSRLAFASLILLLVIEPRISLAGSDGAGHDKRTPAEIARAECSAQANGSKEVVISALAGGIVGMALARDRYIKDCVTSRGYKYVPKKRKKIEYNR